MVLDSWSNWNLEMLIFEKTLEARERINYKLNSHMTPSPGMKKFLVNLRVYNLRTMRLTEILPQLVVSKLQEMLVYIRIENKHFAWVACVLASRARLVSTRCRTRCFSLFLSLGIVVVFLTTLRVPRMRSKIHAQNSVMFFTHYWSSEKYPQANLSATE
jgi:hypothetical protein